MCVIRGVPAVGPEYRVRLEKHPRDYKRGAPIPEEWKRPAIYNSDRIVTTDMDGSTALLAATKAVTLFFGGTITFLSYRAYRRTGSPALRALTFGIGMVTIGVILGGVLHQVVGLPLKSSVSIQSVVTAAGFAGLTYSLYTEQAPSGQTRPPRGHPSDD